MRKVGRNARENGGLSEGSLRARFVSNIFKALVRYPYGRGHIDTARIVPREARLAPVSQHINVCGSNIVFGRCQPHLAASAERVFLQQANGKSSCRRIVSSKLLIYRSNCTVIIALCRTFRIYLQCNAFAVNYGYCHRKPTSTHDARSMLERKVH